jgi:hypothetical protein
MKTRWVLWLAIAVAGLGLVVAILLPSAVHAECPSGAPCAYLTDPRVWVRVAIGAAAIAPALMLMAYQRRGGPRAGGALLALSAGGAVVLALLPGLVPTTLGDCPPYQRCVTRGHPYLGVALAVLLGGTAVAIWLWDKDYPPLSGSLNQ